MVGFKALHLLLLCQVIQQITAASTTKQPARIVCPMIRCIAGCPQRVDSNGCNTCNCENTCQITKCPEGQKCVMSDVVCIKAPCDQQPKCVPNDATTNPPTKRECPMVKCIPECFKGVDSNGCNICNCDNTCQVTKCPEGQKCVMSDVVCKKAPCDQQPKCVPNDEPKTCPPKIVCKEPCVADIGPDGCYSKCSCPPTCRDIKCEANEVCELHEVQCFRAPCFPIPTCLPQKEPKTCPPKIACKEPCVADIGPDGCYSKCSCPLTCTDIKCKADEMCELVRRFCFRAPCFPDPTCFPKNRTCGQSPNVNRCLDGKTFWIRWTYNSSTKSCESFRHYGCSPSPNTFNNRRQCTDTCVPVRSSCPPNTKMCMVNCYYGEKAPGECPECICPCQTVRCSAGHECRLKEGVCPKGERCNPTAYCASTNST